MNNIVDGFDRGEQIGRLAFYNFMKQVKPDTTVEFNPRKYDHYDAFYEGLEVEIKVRENYTNQFDTLVINENKLIGMVELVKDNTFKDGMYINFIKDAEGNIDKAYFWSIRQICKGVKDGTYHWDYKYAPKTTAGDNTMVWKKQLELPKDKAYLFEFDMQSQKWIKIRDGKL